MASGSEIWVGTEASPKLRPVGGLRALPISLLVLGALQGGRFSGGKVSSRQAQCPAKWLAAGIGAASMARRCQNPLQKHWTLPHANAVRGRAKAGTARRGSLFC